MSNKCFGDADKAMIRRIVEEKRAQHLATEERRLREGGIYDAVLGRWVSVEETEAARRRAHGER